MDVTDFVHYASGPDQLTGVQRVVAEVAPLISGTQAVVWNATTAQWVELPADVSSQVIDQGLRAQGILSRDAVRLVAQKGLEGVNSFREVHMRSGDVLVQLGSPWIDQGVLLATQWAAGQGVAVVGFLYDLTPLQGVGHSPEVATGFRRYLTFLSRTRSRVATISQATRTDVDSYLKSHGLPIPEGPSTGLPPGMRPSTEDSTGGERTAAWPRPYVLMVGTIEARKGHLTALHAWEMLPKESRPDLVCVGKWGWGSEEFRTEWEATGEAATGVYVLSSGVEDPELQRLYSDCLATIYPSRWEGWGLPVSESLAFGKLPITTNVSSLPEAGAGLAVLIPPDDPRALADAVIDHILTPDRLRQHETQILESNAYQNPRTWQHVAAQIDEEIRQAQSMGATQPKLPELDIGREYVLGVPAPVQDAATVRIEAIADDRGSPLLGHELNSDDVIVADALISGTFAEPTAWGYPLLPGGQASLRFVAASQDPVTLLIATAPIVGAGTVDITVNDAPGQRQSLGYGEVLTVPIPRADKSTGVHIHIRVVAQDKVDGLPLTLQSVLLVAADDPQARINVLERVARSRSVQLQEAQHQVDALSAQLGVVTSSKSWRFTAPLRRITGDDG